MLIPGEYSYYAVGIENLDENHFFGIMITKYTPKDFLRCRHILSIAVAMVTI